MTQVSKSEQVCSNLSIAIDYDQPIKKCDDFIEVYKNALGEINVINYKGNKKVYCWKHNGIEEYFLTGAITYLSKPHPIFKKRLQLKTWFKDFYNEYKNKTNIKIRIVGIYHYNGLVVFVEFNIDDYIHNDLNSSSAHVFTNDIYQSLCNEKFERIDKNGNHITSIISRNFKKYLLGEIEENKLFKMFEKFNLGFSFGQWLTAVRAIEEMKNKNWYQWKGTEWAGWFLEYKMAQFIDHEHIGNEIIYLANKKPHSYLDFDLHFPKQNFYGDLKSSDITKKEAPANDQVNVLEAITKCEKLWYIIYEHETIKDIDRNNEMAKKRMSLLGTPYEGGAEISYAKRMKHSVKYKKMEILELNRVNMNEVLTVFNQGRQPTGEERLPKFSINKSNIDNYLVYSYVAS